MPLIYLPMFFYSFIVEAMFDGWGHSRHRVTIFSTEDALALPPPQQQRDDGI